MVETPGESQSRDSFPTRSCVGLEVERPPNFRYRPADYVFVRCPEVSRLDWHPFSISSAPEEENILAIHIRATGSRTGALYELFNKMRPPLPVVVGMRTQAVVPVYLDGSYGTPSSNIFESKNAILIGSGIGVTPFAAILKSILLRKLKGDYTLRLQKFHFFFG